MKEQVKRILDKFGIEIRKKDSFEKEAKIIFQKVKDYTMVPENLFLDNLKLVKTFSGVEGSIVECGVWRGGMSAAMAMLLPERKFYLFDSFEGLPPAKEIDGKSALAWQKDTKGSCYYDNCTAEIQYAKGIMEETGVSFELVKGWFDETLPKAIIENIAILRLDADWYDSTILCLKNLYPRIVSGGIIVIDDYYTWDGCSRAVHDYLSNVSSESRIHTTDSGVGYIIKKDR